MALLIYLKCQITKI